ncbi:21057_t:CDS:2, partial [Racocetra persica]
TDNLLFKTEFQKIEELEKEKVPQTQNKYKTLEIQMLFKTNEALLKYQKSPFAASNRNPPLTPKTFREYMNQLSSNIKKLEKLQEQEKNENVDKMLTNLIDHIATIDSNFQKFKEMSDQEAKMHLDNMKYIEALPEGLKKKKLHETYQEIPEQNINLTKAQRRAIQAKLIAIANTSLMKKKGKELTKDLKDPTRTLPITGEPSVQGQGITMHNTEALKMPEPPTVQA